MMGVSRTSIREALRQLESEGLVTILAHRGPVVTEVALPAAEDIYQVRELLEGLAADLFARRKDRDPEAAYEASKEHVRRAAAVVIRSLPEKP